MSTSTVTDNIAHDEKETSNVNMDEYLKRFELIESKNKQIHNLIGTFESQPHDQQRLYVAINAIKLLASHNEKLFDLLVEMNNLFGSK